MMIPPGRTLCSTPANWELSRSITTPAWTPLFAMAAAVVTDVGGPLSHGSIVAREYCIPAVVSVPNACDLPNDTLVTVDGFRGEVAIADGRRWLVVGVIVTASAASIALILAAIALFGPLVGMGLGLVLAAALFCIGVYGVLSRRNAVMVLMGVELMLNAVNINLVAFWRYIAPNDVSGQIFAIIVITIAADNPAATLFRVANIHFDTGLREWEVRGAETRACVLPEHTAGEIR